jgi:pyruvate dehydrogenase E1 component alpha subunit
VVGEEAFLGKKAYRPADEIAEWKKRCPIISFESRYVANKMVTQAELDAIKTEVQRDLDEAVQFAIDSPLPAPEEALEDMFSAA